MKNKNIIEFVKKWAIFFIWFIIIILILTKIGVCFIHEPGHYLTGKLYGCTSLRVSCPAMFGNGSLNHVEGWESCPNLMVMGNQGERICNVKTHTANLSGFILSLMVIVPLFLVINNIYLKKKIKKFYLEGKYFILILIIIIVWAFKSSAVDLFKIAECLVNNSFATKLLNLLIVVPDVYIYTILIIFIVDVYLFLIKQKLITFGIKGKK